MTSLDFLADARRWQGTALLEGLRQAPARIQFSPAGARASLATRLAKVSPVHALLAVLRTSKRVPRLAELRSAQLLFNAR